MDFVASGQDENYDEFLGVYLNDGTGKFTISLLEGEGLGSSSVDVGDLNNDGYYDFIVIGDDADYNGWIKVFLYDNTNNTFAKTENTGLYNLGSQGNIQLFDYNNDNHLDVLASGFDWAHEDMLSMTKLFRNISTEENQEPNPPTTFNLERVENRLNFTWNGATDDKTPTEALQYEIKVGSTAGAQDIAKYVVTTPSWFLELAEIPENVYWSVKAIDASKVYSASSEEQLSLIENSASNPIQIYPNPASEKVYIKANELEAVELFDLQGKKINAKLTADHSINISTLPNGVYILKLKVNGKVISKKLIIQ